MIYLVFAVIALLLRSVLTGTIFYLLSARKAAWINCFKLTVVAGALNKLFISASGFIAGSYCSRFAGLPAVKVFGNFLIIEILSVLGWILLAVYFGAKAVLLKPSYLALVFLILLVLFYFQRARAARLWKILQEQTVNVGRNIFWCGLYAGLDMFLFAFYYKVLLLYFKIDIGANKILELIALSFSAGYLSPAPSGLGVKDLTLAGLLMTQGASGAQAGIFALMDRAIMMIFWLVLGLCLCGGLLKQAWLNRKEVGRD